MKRICQRAITVMMSHAFNVFFTKVVAAMVCLMAALPLTSGAADDNPADVQDKTAENLTRLKPFLDAKRWGAAIALLDSNRVHGDVKRETVPLMTGWRFLKASVEGAGSLDFDDSQWDAVNLPHTWNATDGSDGGTYYRGDGWYRMSFRVSTAWVSRQIYLEFEGANRTAEVFLNGSRLGEHRGGFARFRFDATPVINFDGDNVLAVRVNNGEDDNVAPLSGDFTMFGGLYRGVALLATDRIQIETLDYASAGVYARTLKVTPAAAELEIRTKLANRETADRQLTVRTSIFDATGAVAVSTVKQQLLAGKARGEVTQRVSLLTPHLWDGRRNPYLYTVRIEVLTDGTVRDVVEEPLGVRSFSVDADEGLILNGRPFELRGVNRHQDRAGLGWAITAAEDEEDMAFILEMGCNADRTAHYQQSAHWYDLADRHGLVLWTEVPVVSDVIDTPEFFENCRTQLRELIRQNYNHPSILFWGIGNESFVRDKAVTPADTNDRLLRELAAVVREEDSTRLSAYASNGDVSEKRATFSDVIGFNHYFGWYHDLPEDFERWLDLQRSLRPDLRIAMSEYGAGANPAHHEEPARKPVANGEWHPEEWQAQFHETYWRALERRPWVWGKFIWCMFDLASDGRDEGGIPGLNDKGLVTADRKTKKDAFYWYKANWSDLPVLHITSQRFTPRSDSPTSIKVYANAERVELFVNGESVGTRAAKDRIFKWANIALRRGENHVQAQANIGGQKLTDECTWMYAPAAAPGVSLPPIRSP